MRISPIKNLTFKGHQAGKIKSLYMQNSNFQSQVGVYNQMREIGKQEGFDVFIHDTRKIEKEKLDGISKTYNPWGVWSQDNKLLIKQNGKTIAVSPEFYDKKELVEASDFCDKTKIKGYLSEFMFEGGNIYLGKKDNNENYLITSTKNAYLAGEYLYLKEKLGSKPDYVLSREFFRDGVCHDKKGNLIATEEEFDKEWEFWVKKAIEIAMEDFDIKRENMIFIPEADFHVDMTIRPLEYPYVLVNDDSEVDKLIEKLEKQFTSGTEEAKELERFKGTLARHRKDYSSSDEICEKLEMHGFQPIKIAGAYGRNPVNFINAIVHKNDDGLVYITNSTKHGSKLYQAMQEHFEKDLMEKCPQIKRVHYVDGGEFEKNKNNIMYYLGNGNGGIHCLCTEEME